MMFKISPVFVETILYQDEILYFFTKKKVYEFTYSHQDNKQITLFSNSSIWECDNNDYVIIIISMLFWVVFGVYLHDFQLRVIGCNLIFFRPNVDKRNE